MGELSLTVAVPSVGRPSELERCLAALATQTRAPDKILVIARKDDHETVAVARRAAGAEVVFTRMPGLAAGIQRAVDVVVTDIVAFTDDDAVPKESWVASIIGSFQGDARLGALGGRDIMHTVAMEDTVEGSVRGRGPTVGRVTTMGRLLGNHHVGTGAPRPVHHLKGANMAYRTVAVRGFRFADEVRGNGAQYGNELFLCLYVAGHGWSLSYDPGVLVDHYPAPRPRTDPRSDQSTARIRVDVRNRATAFTWLAPWRLALRVLLYQIFVGTRQAPGLGVFLVDRTCGRDTPTADSVLAGLRGAVEGVRDGWRLRQRSTS